MSLRPQALVATSLLLAALGAWIVTVQRMRGMDGGPGTDLGAFGWFLGIWVTMMAAMMLPSAAPTVMLFSRLSGARRVAIFVLGYLIAWTAYGLAAYGVYRGIRSIAPSFVDWHQRGSWVAGGALVLAGLYQLTPLKVACLRHCRAPLSFLVRDRWGALALGVGDGAYCIGCCWGLMLALFALGVMSLLWMVVVGAAIFVEKVIPGGEQTARALAVCLLVLGVWVAGAPGSVPGLTQPGAHSMQMETMR